MEYHNSSYSSSFTGPMTLALLGGSAVALAIIGWIVGPQKKEQPPSSTHPQAAQHQHQQQQHQQIPDEKELELQSMMQQLNELLKLNNIARAEKLAENILQFTEKTWGKTHLNYGLLLGIPIAQIYELKGDQKEVERALLTAARILKPYGEEYLTETAIAEKLITVLSARNEYGKALEFGNLLVSTCREARKSNPTDPQTVEKFCVAASKVAAVSANAGKFGDADKLYKEILKVIGDYAPTSQTAFAALEFWTNALHQQGKTTEAINKLEEYKRKVVDFPDGAATVRKILHRAAVLLFTVDKFSDTLNYLNDLVTYSTDNRITISSQMYCELATVYWELDMETEARSIQDRIKRESPSLSLSNLLPLTRSKYLCTMECGVQDEAYKLTMRINREQPRRKEGEVLEDTEQIKRKLDTCFLEVTFEPTSSAGQPIVITQTVDKPYQFTVESPKMGQAEPGRFYEVVFDIYSSPRREKKLGVHHQLVYASPSSSYVGKTSLRGF